MRDITLVCIDSQRKEQSKKVIENMTKIFPCKKSLFFSHDIKSDVVDVIDIGEIKGWLYTDFVLKKLYQYIDTNHVLIVQYDGYILNPHLWQDEFLDWDYVGAPWSTEQIIGENYGTMENIVGNGGFSLRSKRFLEVSKEIFQDKETNDSEDFLCCIKYRKEFLQRNIKFAPIELAFRFSIEDVFPEEFVSESLYEFKKPFGYHRHFFDVTDYLGKKEYFEKLIDNDAGIS